MFNVSGGGLYFGLDGLLPLHSKILRETLDCLGIVISIFQGFG